MFRRNGDGDNDDDGNDVASLRFLHVGICNFRQLKNIRKKMLTKKNLFFHYRHLLRFVTPQTTRHIRCDLFTAFHGALATQHSKLIFNVHLRAHMARGNRLKTKTQHKKIRKRKRRVGEFLSSFSSLPTSSPTTNNKRAKKKKSIFSFFHFAIIHGTSNWKARASNRQLDDPEKKTSEEEWKEVKEIQPHRSTAISSVNWLLRWMTRVRLERGDY